MKKINYEEFLFRYNFKQLVRSGYTDEEIMKLCGYCNEEVVRKKRDRKYNFVQAQLLCEEDRKFLGIKHCG